MRAFALLYAAEDGPLRHGDTERMPWAGPSRGTPVVLDQQVMSSGMPSLNAVNTCVSISRPVWQLARMGPVRATVLSAHTSSSGSPSARRASHLCFTAAQKLAQPFPVAVAFIPAPDEAGDEGDGI